MTGAVFREPQGATFDELGGFDEVFAHDYQDVDFCLRAVERVRSVVHTPSAELPGSSSASGSSERRRTRLEVALFRERWAPHSWSATPTTTRTSRGSAWTTEP